MALRGVLCWPQRGVPPGVEKRMDVIATALQAGRTVFDLEQAELCYAPQYGAAGGSQTPLSNPSDGSELKTYRLVFSKGLTPIPYTQHPHTNTIFSPICILHLHMALPIPPPVDCFEGFRRWPRTRLTWRP